MYCTYWLIIASRHTVVDKDAYIHKCTCMHKNHEGGREEAQLKRVWWRANVQKSLTLVGVGRIRFSSAPGVGSAFDCVAGTAGCAVYVATTLSAVCSEWEQNGAQGMQFGAVAPMMETIPILDVEFRRSAAAVRLCLDYHRRSAAQRTNPFL